ncbi:MAG: lysylphosphatidylglycerol synthase transmembrane domain-containing protein [Thermomicrobiales bacterium]
MGDPAGPEEQSPGHGGLLRRLAAIPTPLVFLFSVGIALAILWRQGSFSDVIDAARRANALAIAAGLLLYLISLALLSVRWHILVVMINGVSRLPRAAEAFLTSVVVNYAAPIGLAVPTRAALTKRALGLSAGQTGAVALWEVALDVAVLSLLTLVWLVIIRSDAGELGRPSDGQLTAGAAVVVAGVLLLVAAALYLRRKSRWWGRLRHLVQHTATYPLRRPRVAALAAGASIVYWLGQAIVLWLLLEALTDDASPSLALGVVSIPVLVGMLSPVPGGAGIREALMLAVARVHDADTGAVLLAALAYRVALFAAIPVLYAGVRIWLSVDGPASPTAPGRGTMSAAAPDDRSSG